jgi:hypothetical protein
MDDVQIEVVGDDVPSTDEAGIKKVQNLGFEQGLVSWIPYNMRTTAETDSYTMGVDIEMAHTGNLGAYIRSIAPPKPHQYGELGLPAIYAGYYQGKTVRFSAYINADKVEDHVSLWAVSPGKDSQGKPVVVPSETLIQGTAQQDGASVDSGHEGWQRYDVSIHVPENAPNIIFDIRLIGEGEVWIDDVQFEIIN